MKTLDILLSALAAEPLAIEENYLEQFKAQVAAGLFEQETMRAGRGEPAIHGSVAVLNLNGPMAYKFSWLAELFGWVSTEKLSMQLQQVAADSSVSSILLNIDSPGGQVTGTQELYDTVREVAKAKPVVASANSMAASAAYYVASAATEISVIPSGSVGSIGVFAVHYDYSKMLENEGIKPTIIKAGKFKAEGAPEEPLSEEAREEMQRRVDRTYEQFLKSVAQGRGVSVATVRNDFGQGRMLEADRAKAVGMVDRVETLQQTLSRMTGSYKPKRSGRRAEVIQLKQKLLG